ncbi:putative stizolobate synthase [Medicago truncatula]|uniref:Putative stizolobate synthase n=1 Tax=Medicago truncatula TaxID=3880 RepID=A0A396HCJ2_MEDTR|nr:putative stizolobate synthase [Medicago truncatula]
MCFNLSTENRKCRRKKFTFVPFSFVPMSLNFFRYWQLKYPAPGAPKLAKRVKEQIEASGLSQVDEDKKRRS